VQKTLGAIFSLLTAAAGWHYLFYSRAAHRLGILEDAALNERRVTLRRVNGVVMILLAIVFLLGFYTVDADLQPAAFLGIWVAVFLLLLAVVFLALIDLRLTFKLRDRRRDPRA
jgi:drug/metabolite transporter (DMT)-like permease